MQLKNYFKAAAGFALAAAVFAQTPETSMAPTLRVSQTPTVKLKRGTATTVTLQAVLPPGYHANSNTPTDQYLIPLTLKWTNGPLQAGEVTYPKASMEKYSFSDKPISVVSGDFTFTTKFTAPGNAPTGPSAQNGTIRYQACNDRMCFPPKNLPVSISVNIE